MQLRLLLTAVEGVHLYLQICMCTLPNPENVKKKKQVSDLSTVCSIHGLVQSLVLVHSPEALVQLTKFTRLQTFVALCFRLATQFASSCCNHTHQLQFNNPYTTLGRFDTERTDQN